MSRRYIWWLFFERNVGKKWLFISRCIGGKRTSGYSQIGVVRVKPQCIPLSAAFSPSSWTSATPNPHHTQKIIECVYVCMCVCGGGGGANLKNSPDLISPLNSDYNISLLQLSSCVLQVDYFFDNSQNIQNEMPKGSTYQSFLQPSA